VGSPGPVVLALCGPCSSPASGTGTVPQAVVDAIQAGTAYVNVHTVTNKGGEIRGQLATTASVSTGLTSRQEVPKPKGNVKRATGTFTATVAKLGTGGTVAWVVQARLRSPCAVRAGTGSGERRTSRRRRWPRSRPDAAT